MGCFKYTNKNIEVVIDAGGDYIVPIKGNQGTFYQDLIDYFDEKICQDNNTTTNKKALLNLEIIHKFILAILERVKLEYNMSLRSIRKHLSNNFEEFLPELLCYLMLHG